jgi:DNA-binding IclR family transcriptional regulator
MNTAPRSTRRATQETGQFTRSTEGSRSLERGLALLRVFKTGTSSLTNADLAQRTGLPRPTVSRLTRSLVDSGFLTYDVAQGAYRLSAVVLSLADAYRFAHQATEVAGPLMREFAQAHRVNVGLAVADQTEMVYLVSVRHSQDSVSKLRRVTSGMRVPVQQTAVGLAYLAALPPVVLQSVLAKVCSGICISPERKALEAAIVETRRRGYSVAAFVPGNGAVGRAFVGPDQQLYAMNISFEAREGAVAQDRRRHAQHLKGLIEVIQRALAA